PPSWSPRRRRARCAESQATQATQATPGDPRRSEAIRAIPAGCPARSGGSPYHLRMATIAVIGTGYVGLTTGVCFAHLGHDVICADVVPDKVERLSRGESTILERGLDELLREGIKEGRLTFVLPAAGAVRQPELVPLC